MAIITIIGAGMMGSGISRPARENGHEVRLVGTVLDDHIIDRLKQDNWHLNMKRTLPDGISYYHFPELDAALDGCDYVVGGVSSFGVEFFAREVLPHLKKGEKVLSVTKGLLDDEAGNLQTFPEYLATVRPDIAFSAIGGPCTSYELMDKHQTMVYFCGPDAEVLNEFKKLLSTDYYHIGISTDIRGVEGCAALKNAYACGVSLGIGLAEKLEGENAYMYNPQAALFGQSVREMTRLVKLLGGNPELAGGIPGAGDLFVTIFGGRTRMLGKLLGLGQSYPEVKAKLSGVTLEAVVIITVMSRALRRQAEAGKVDLRDYPLLLFLDGIINGNQTADIPWKSFR